MSADTDLRDALVEKMRVRLVGYDGAEQVDWDLLSEDLADIALNVIKNWTVELPQAEYRHTDVGFDSKRGGFYKEQK